VQVNALGIFLRWTTAAHRIGVLFRYALAEVAVTQRFMADEGFVKRSNAPVLSTAMLADNPEEQCRLWQDYSSTLLSGRHSTSNGCGSCQASCRLSSSNQAAF
jgi:serine/threonine-protein kinase HipA